MASESDLVPRRVTRSMTRSVTQDSDQPKRKLDVDDDIMANLGLKERPHPNKRPKPSGGSRSRNQAMRSPWSLLKRGRNDGKKDNPAGSQQLRIPERIFCTVCEKILPSISFDNDAPCFTSHLPDVCRACLGSRMRLSLQSGNIKSICCPNCSSTWQTGYLRKFFTESEIAQYGNLSVQHPKYVVCPKPGCEHGQIHPPGLRDPHVTCEKCSYEFCFAHRVAWHVGLSCAQYFDQVNATFENEDESRDAKENETPSNNIKADVSCQYCGNKSLNRDREATILNCPNCAGSFCAECQASMLLIRSNGLHKHEKDCRFWAHKGWDSENEVRRGVERLTLERQNFKNGYPFYHPVAPGPPQMPSLPAAQPIDHESNGTGTLVEAASHMLVPPYTYFADMPTSNSLFPPENAFTNAQSGES